ncbi:MAG: cysteine desulfurase family protein [Candidatus Spechtbacterales bacterium]|nr:cysteine desulfurase family protein [Candidatus Spechtbacterales bacterium]
MREIYLDNNASTPLAPEVLEAMLPYYREYYGNPSSLHKKGIEAERALKETREKLAGLFHVKTSEVFFTSGATEADNWALKGVARALKRRGKHIITTKVEHEAVLEACHALGQEGYEITFLDVDEYGKVKKEDILGAINDNTIMVAIMSVNNELGTIYPVNEFAKETKTKKEDIIFFTDGVQAFGKLEVNMENVDIFALSGHKIHGPKGIGALIKKENVQIEPLIHGGGQEMNMRSGTENVAGIVGLGKAAEISYENLDKNKKHIQTLRDKFIRTIKEIDDIRINSPEDAICSTVNVAFAGIPAEVLLHALEEKGIYASTGSACASNSGNKSHVLHAIGLDDKYSDSTLRFGLSRYNTKEEIGFTCKVLKEITPELREVTGRK